jgi:hypothetical protein
MKLLELICYEKLHNLQLMMIVTKCRENFSLIIQGVEAVCIIEGL